MIKMPTIQGKKPPVKKGKPVGGGKMVITVGKPMAGMTGGKKMGKC